MLQTVVNGWPLLPVVMGLVELVKKVFPGLKGGQIVGVSFVIGAGLGAGWLLSAGTPSNFADWFFFGLGCAAYGLIPCGLYDVATTSKNGALPKIWK